MDPPMTKAGFDVARMKAKSVLEQQRLAAMYSGDFYRQILPVMYDASIIDQERFLLLMATREIQTAISTRELIDLAVAWGVTPSGAEFWKRHKSRDELIRALQQAKLDAETQARLAEQQAVTSPQDAERAARKDRAGSTQHRSAMVVLGDLYGGKDVQGDIFGSKGDYTGGIIYMARRVRMDADSATEHAKRRAAATSLALAARAKSRARRNSLALAAEARAAAGGAGTDEDYLEDEDDAAADALLAAEEAAAALAAGTLADEEAGGWVPGGPGLASPSPHSLRRSSHGSLGTAGASAVAGGLDGATTPSGRRASGTSAAVAAAAAGGVAERRNSAGGGERRQSGGAAGASLAAAAAAAVAALAAEAAAAAAAPSSPTSSTNSSMPTPKARAMAAGVGLGAIAEGSGEDGGDGDLLMPPFEVGGEDDDDAAAAPKESVDDVTLALPPLSLSSHASEAGAVGGAPLLSARGDVRLQEADGSMHRVGSMRYKPADKQALQAGLILSQLMAKQGGGEPSGESSSSQAPGLRGSSQAAAFHSGGSRGAAVDALLPSVQAFVDKHSHDEDEEAAAEAEAARPGTTGGSRTSSASGDVFSSLRIQPALGAIASVELSTLGGTVAAPPPGSSRGGPTTAGFTQQQYSGGGGGTPGGGDVLPAAQSKLDLYYRPVRDAERMTLVIPATPSQPQPQPDWLLAQQGGGGGGDALDTLLRRPGPASPFVSMSPAAAHGVADPHTTLQPLALRHRLGGRAGKLARDMSSKLRDQLTTADVHLDSAAFDGPFAAASPQSARAHTAAFGGGPPPMTSLSAPATGGGLRLSRAGLPSSQGHRGARAAAASFPGDDLHAAAAAGRAAGLASRRGRGFEAAAAAPSYGGAINVDALAQGAGASPITKLIGDYVELASKPRAPGAVGRDAQFDAVSKKVNKLRAEALKAHANHQLVQTFAGGAAAAAAAAPSRQSTAGGGRR